MWAIQQPRVGEAKESFSALDSALLDNPHEAGCDGADG
jgi:hypothetical protein